MEQLIELVSSLHWGWFVGGGTVLSGGFGMVIKLVISFAKVYKEWMDCKKVIKKNWPAIEKDPKFKDLLKEFDDITESLANVVKTLPFKKLKALEPWLRDLIKTEKKDGKD